MDKFKREINRTIHDMRKGTSAMEIVDVSELDKAMLKDGDIVPIFAEKLLDFSDKQIRYWLHMNAIYQLITHELVQFIEPIIRRGPAVEICAGAGILGKALDIACVDNYQQQKPEFAAMYFALQQPTIKYGQHVIPSEATEWVEKHRPEVVVASWVCERRPGGVSTGAIEGPKEEIIQDISKFYVLIGTTAIHHGKAIFNKPHFEITAPWLYSRASSHRDNRIWIWGDWKPEWAKGLDFEYKEVP